MGGAVSRDDSSSRATVTGLYTSPLYVYNRACVFSVHSAYVTMSCTLVGAIQEIQFYYPTSLRRQHGPRDRPEVDRSCSNEELDLEGRDGGLHTSRAPLFPRSRQPCGTGSTPRSG